MKPSSQTLAVAALCVVYAAGSTLDVMEVDAAQYAAISQDMARGGDLLHLHFRGADYLDKPPLLFWASALSFKLFGVHNWSYKLPSILAAVFAIFGTYRLARLYHGEGVGRRAGLMLGSSFALVLMVNDVRCDTLLMASVITAIWCGAEYIEQRRWSYLVGVSVAVGAGMLAKGPMGLMAPLLALGGHVALKHRWALLRDARLLLVPVIVGLILLPMCIGLYAQFGWYGLRFYFWEQSFGRLTGENVWKDGSSPFFFTHELLWQMLPWTVFALGGLWMELKVLVGRSRSVRPEWIAISGAVLVFLALSLSQFKLPHYLYVVHPLFCILAAKALPDLASRGWQLVQAGLLVVLFGLGAALMLWSFPDALWTAGTVAIAAGIGAVTLLAPVEERLFTGSFCTMIGLALVMNLHFYPNLLPYQASAEAGRWLVAHQVTSDRFIALHIGGTALDHYAGFPVRYASNAIQVQDGLVEGTVVFTNDQGRKELLDLGLRPVQEKHLLDFRVQLLTLAFLDPSRRGGQLGSRYLLIF
jgi:hypothetical protein